MTEASGAGGDGRRVAWGIARCTTDAAQLGGAQLVAGVVAAVGP